MELTRLISRLKKEKEFNFLKLSDVARVDICSLSAVRSKILPRCRGHISTELRTIGWVINDC